MQFRISEGPYTALGIPEIASADEVRSAFLALTKQYHPARFGRMSPETQRLSNEVFLGIKAAHDQLMKMLGGGRRSVAGQSGAMPAIRPEATGRATGANPALTRPTAQPVARVTDRPSTPAVSRTMTPMQPSTRPSTPPGGLPQTGRTPTPQGLPPQTARPGTPQPARPVPPQAVRPTTPTPAARTTPAMGTPIQRPITPVTRPTTPVTRPGTPPTAGRPASPPAPTNYNPETIRHSGVPAFDERTAHREAMILLNEQDWPKARQTLQQLAQHRPQSKNYGALLAYARGREAQQLGRAADAALEYQRALELEPDLSMAKQALAEVQRRR